MAVMIVFVDESGIHKSVEHSTFAVVFVAISRYSEFERSVEVLEKKLRIEKFHWAKTVWSVREKFFEALMRMDFVAKIAVVKNPIHPEKSLEKTISLLLTESKIHTLCIDGKKSKRYVRQMKKILRDKGISTRKLKMVDDRGSAGVRVADALAGLARVYFDGKTDERVRKWYGRFRKKKITLVLESLQ